MYQLRFGQTPHREQRRGRQSLWLSSESTRSMRPTETFAERSVRSRPIVWTGDFD